MIRNYYDKYDSLNLRTREDLWISEQRDTATGMQQHRKPFTINTAFIYYNVPRQRYIGLRSHSDLRAANARACAAARNNSNN